VIEVTGKSSKFYSKSLTLLLPLLKLINRGYTATEIAKELNKSKSLLSYYIKKAEKLGYVKESMRDAFKSLELTQAGQNFLDQCEKIEPTHICRAENIRFKAEVLEMPRVPIDWNRVQMHNWVQYTSKVDNVYIKLNMGEKPTVELLPSPVDGEDPNELLITLVYDCTNVINAIHERFGIKLGRLQSSSRGEWVVYDPIAKNLCQYNGQVTVDGIGKVNASKPRNIGEFEFHDPRALVDYMAMPRRLYNVERKVSDLEAKVDEILNLLKQKRLNYAA
jgi:DNA-binding MarR family transcriptional regulator